MPLTDEHKPLFFYFIIFLKDENKSFHKISMMKMNNENYEIIQKKRKKKKMKISKWGV